MEGCYRLKKKFINSLIIIFLILICGIIILFFMKGSKDVSLRDHAERKDFLIGSAINSQYIKNDKLYTEIARKEFNIITPENELKMKVVHPEIDTYNFSKADEVVNFAKENGQQIRGHTLIWSESLPDWLEHGNYTELQMRQLLKEHIQTVVTRYKDEINVWDVVNEAFDDNGNFVNSKLLDIIGPEYIELSFQWAYEANPNALLFYNDDDIEGLNQHSNAVYNLVRDLKNRGIPIHGVGFQMHKNLSENLNYESISKNIERYGKIGVQVHITEMDINIDKKGSTLKSNLSKQANMYSNVLHTCLNSDNICTAMVTWGFTDKYTWLGNKSKPLIYNEDYQKKLAYKGLLKELDD